MKLKTAPYEYHRQLSSHHKFLKNNIKTKINKIIKLTRKTTATLKPPKKLSILD